jgi:16S rRNA (guanine527-N7)-methyltransferase
MSELTEVIDRYGIEVDVKYHEQLTAFCHNVWQFNKQLNLTRHTDFEKFVTRDLVDTWEVAKLLKPGEQVLDVGTGGGVPGLVLKIIRPDLDISCAESVKKKAAALSQIAEAAEIDVAVYDSRAESLLEDFRFDAVTARAVGPLWKICTWFEGCWISMGRLLAIKGPKWPEEKAEAEEKGLLGQVDMTVASEYPTPQTEWQSTILMMWAKGAPEPGK